MLPRAKWCSTSAISGSYALYSIWRQLTGFPAYLERKTAGVVRLFAGRQNLFKDTLQFSPLASACHCSHRRRAEP